MSLSYTTALNVCELAVVYSENYSAIFYTIVSNPVITAQNQHMNHSTIRLYFLKFKTTCVCCFLTLFRNEIAITYHVIINYVHLNIIYI